MSQKIKVVGINGSLRKQSINEMLLKEAGKMLPENTEFTIADISEIPLFNQDLENDMPESVLRMKEIVGSAEAVIFSTPEYNYSIPGVLKNVIDWLSRPYGQSSLNGKTVAIIGATGGNFGTMAAQMHLRQIVTVLNMKMVNQPMVLISQAQSKFNEEGNLTDPMAIDLLKTLMSNLVDFTQQLKK